MHMDHTCLWRSLTCSKVQRREEWRDGGSEGEMPLEKLWKYQVEAFKNHSLTSLLLVKPFPLLTTTALYFQMSCLVALHQPHTSFSPGRDRPACVRKCVTSASLRVASLPDSLFSPSHSPLLFSFRTPQSGSDGTTTCFSAGHQPTENKLGRQVALGEGFCQGWAFPVAERNQYPMNCYSHWCLLIYFKHFYSGVLYTVFSTFLYLGLRA